MTDYQDALVLENLDLVNWVIRTRISIPNRPLLTYDDFYAIGCEAICRAALKYQPDMGAFAPFACRYIYNAIVDHCRAMNYRLERNVEISEDENASLLDTYAFVDRNGDWTGSGDMGWFGISSNDKDERAWNDEIQKLMNEAKDDDFLAIVDCHI